jgi:hypothetical protein
MNLGIRGQTFCELATQMCTMKDVWVSGSENSFLFVSSSLAILHGGYLSCYLPQGATLGSHWPNDWVTLICSDDHFIITPCMDEKRAS